MEIKQCDVIDQVENQYIQVYQGLGEQKHEYEHEFEQIQHVIQKDNLNYQIRKLYLVIESI